MEGREEQLVALSVMRETCSCKRKMHKKWLKQLFTKTLEEKKGEHVAKLDWD